MSQPLSCRIEVRGLLSASWAQAFDVTLQPAPVGTLLTCSVSDQAALHGLLALIRDTGVPIISISVEPQTKEA